MNPLIKEKIKEGKLRLARKLKLHQCSVVTTANALLIMEETIADVIEAQKQSDVEVIKEMSVDKLHCEMHVPCMKCAFIVLDEAITKIQG